MTRPSHRPAAASGFPLGPGTRLRLARPLAALALLLGARPAPAQDTTRAAADLPPAGYGTLRQEDVAVRLRTATFAIRLLPLDERILRLLAPDSYAALHQLAQSLAPTVAETAQRAGLQAPSLMLVTFFGLQPQARFVPEDLTIASRNRFFRPVAIVPITPRWSEQQLGQRETASALYLYENGIALFEPFVVSYGGTSSTDWERTLPVLDRERAAVWARAKPKP